MLRPHPVQLAFEARFVPAADKLSRVVASGNPVPDEVLRDYWQAIVATLEAYRSKENGVPHGPPIEPLSPQITFAIEEALRHLLAGRLPADWNRLLKRGGSAIGPAEKRDIECAARYIALVKKGIITVDPHPIKTVAGAYGVNERTASGWKRYTPADIANWHLSAGDEQRAELATSLMFKAGERYRQCGRSASAIQTRGKKRHRA